MSDDLDLDAVAAAEAEASEKGFVFRFGGKRFECPPVLPWQFLDLATKDTKLAYDFVLGDQAEAFWEKKPGRKVMEALGEGIGRHYGIGKWGNSSASAASSKNGTGRSRQTSSASTE